MIKIYILKICPRLPKYYAFIMTILLVFAFTSVDVFAGDMWTVGADIIKNVYGKIAGVSTTLAGLMSAVAVIGAKMSNNQHKVDQSWDWLKRIWVAWAAINVRP